MLQMFRKGLRVQALVLEKHQIEVIEQNLHEIEDTANVLVIQVLDAGVIRALCLLVIAGDEEVIVQVVLLGGENIFLRKVILGGFAGQTQPVIYQSRADRRLRRVETFHHLRFAVL